MVLVCVPHVELFTVCRGNSQTINRQTRLCNMQITLSTVSPINRIEHDLCACFLGVDSACFDCVLIRLSKPLLSAPSVRPVQILLKVR